MGEYFDFVNIDTKEIISPYDFNLGCKYVESSNKHSLLIGVLHTLLADQWNHCSVVWYGDELDCTDKDQFIDIYDCKNISGQFRESESIVRKEIELSLIDNDNSMTNFYSVNKSRPFDGLFVKHIQSYKYVINYSKKLYYETRTVNVIMTNNHFNDIDPLPFLLGYGRSCDNGEWLFDKIGTSNKVDASYTKLEQIRIEH